MLILSAIADCEGNTTETVPDPLSINDITGTWSEPCINDSGTGYDVSNAVVVQSTAPNFTYNASIFFSGDSSCTALFLTDTGDGDIVFGDVVATTLNGESVYATEVDISYNTGFWAGTVDYTIAYLDTSVTPNRLYYGDRGSNPYAGYSPAYRPGTLDLLGYWER